MPGAYVSAGLYLIAWILRIGLVALLLYTVYRVALWWAKQEKK